MSAAQPADASSSNSWTVLFNSIPKMSGMADDFKRMVDYMNELRLLTFGVVASLYLAAIVFLIAFLCKKQEKHQQEFRQQLCEMSQQQQQLQHQQKPPRKTGQKTYCVPNGSAAMAQATPVYSPPVSSAPFVFSNDSAAAEYIGDSSIVLSEPPPSASRRH